MESQTWETVEWINGKPSHDITVEARLTTPPRVVCRQVVNEPAALTHRGNEVFSTGIRIATAFMGVSELALGGLPLLLTDQENLGPAGIAALSFVALDGLTAVILAAAVPSKFRESVHDRYPARYTINECPPGLSFELGMESFPILPNGELLPADATYVMREIVETGMPLGLRNGDLLTMTTVPPETRCAWAVHLGHAAERALCPQAPGVIHVPVRVPVAVPVPVPSRRPPPRR